MPTWLGSLQEYLQLELQGSPFPDLPHPDKISPDILTASLFNPLHPSIIQIIGPIQQAQFASFKPSTRKELLQQLRASTKLLILCDGLVEFETSSSIAVATTPLSCHKVLAQCMFAINKINRQQETPHGVFLDILSLGVLLTGSPNIGKSELALELITRGYALIADDSPCFSISKNTIQGISPELLKDFIEVRGLGILNVRAMFGDSAVKHSKNLALVINLRHFEPDEIADRLFDTVTSMNFLGQTVDCIEIPVAAGRNLAILVETAVRNYKLRLKGYNSAKEFIKRQRSIMDSRTE